MNNDLQTSTYYAVDRNGVRGILDFQAVPPEGSESRLVLVRLADNSSVFADTSLFVEKEPNVFFFPGSFAVLREQNSNPSAQSAAPQTVAATAANQNQLVVPLLAEQLRVARQLIVTGGVRVHKTVSERTETIDEPFIQEQVDVERVAINRFVEEVPSVRNEGDVMIVPILEEVIVVEKRLVLREEIRINKRRQVISNPQSVVLRREEARLERIEPSDRQLDDKNFAAGIS